MDEEIAMIFNFNPINKDSRNLVHQWLQEPHVSEWFYGDGLKNTLKHLDEFLAGESLAQYWIGYDSDRPIAFFITSNVNKPTDELTKWCVDNGATITLDMFIGDKSYLGKGLAAPLIKAFLSSRFPEVKEVLIDPEASNTKAIHVYSKAGFKKIGEFIPSHSLHPHIMMRLNT